MRWCIAFCSLIFSVYAASAQAPPSFPAKIPSKPVLQSTSANASSNASSSLLQNLLQEKRSATVASITFYKPFKEFGRVLQTSTAAFTSIDKRSVQWLDYTGLPDIVSARLPATFPLFLGLQGAFNHLSILGASPRDVAVMMNGRPMGNAGLGATYLEQLPPEMAEQIEVFVGSDAAIIANNASGAALNIQEIRHDTKNLYTRLWYQQFGDQFTAADVDVSNNIAPNLNLTLGARTHAATRLYANTGSRLWNARAILRWNPSSTASLSLSYLLTSHRVTLNGGLQPTTNGSADVISSLSLFNELQETTLRHDLTLTGSAFLTPDSSLTATLSAYASIDGRSLERASLQGSNVATSQTVLSPDLTIQQATTTNISIGATGRLETRVTLFSALEASLLAGGTVALHSVPENIYWSASTRLNGLLTSPKVRTQSELAAFGRLGLTLLKSLDLSGGARLTLVGNRPELSFGAKASLYLVHSTTTSVQFWADASRSFRLPSVTDEGAAAPFSTTAILSESHLLGIAGLRFQEQTEESNFTSEILAYGRIISNPILYEPAQFTYTSVTNFANIPLETINTTISTVKAYNAQSRLILGASLTADWYKKNAFGSFAGFVLSGFANLTLSQTNGADDSRFPLLYAGATAQLEFRFGRDVLRAGARVRVMTPFAGERFSPMLWAYIPSSEQQSLAGNGIDIVAGAEIFGSLFLRATYQNALGTPTYTVQGYPQFPTVLRFTVSATLGN